VFHGPKIYHEGVTTAVDSRANTVSVPVRRLRADAACDDFDCLAAEAPLEIRFDGRPFTVLLRTPGHDEELVLGFLYAEGIIQRRRDVLELRRPAEFLDEGCHNVLDLTLDAQRTRPPVERTFYSSASCGACGKSSIAELEVRAPVITSRLTIAAALLAGLPERLRAAQPGFAATGGLHGSALVQPDGELIAVREDIGRHNAVDKLIGWALTEGRLPLAESVLFISGRLGFEIVQKAIVAGIPIIGAIGAASSLAVALALSHGQTLATFVRPGALNLFGDATRIRGPVAAAR
jgi:FdhD protein